MQLLVMQFFLVFFTSFILYHSMLKRHQSVRSKMWGWSPVGFISS